MEKPQIIQVKTLYGVTFLNIYSIVSIRNIKRHSVLMMNDETILEAYHPIKYFEHILPKPNFCRCHCSYIIHCKYILGIDFSASNIKLNGYGIVKFSRKYKEPLINNLKQFIAEN